MQEDALQTLAEKVWIHPASGDRVRYTAKTIEGWYSKAKQAPEDPVSALRRAVRKDTGQRAVPPSAALLGRSVFLRVARDAPGTATFLS